MTLAAAAAAGSPPDTQRRRRRLLSQFWDEVVQHRLGAPESAETLTAAAVLLNRAKAEAERAQLGGAP